MEQPQGYENDDQRQTVCHLLHSLYCSKQAPSQWNEVLDEFLGSKLNMAVCTADACIHTRNADGCLLIIALYVDELLIPSSCVDEVRKAKHALSGRFKMKDLGEPRLILGIKIQRSRELDWCTISKTMYSRKIIKRFGLDKEKGTRTPIKTWIDLSQTCEKHDCPYREAIGSPMYLAVGMRPDILFAVSVSEKYVECPGEIHWNAIKKLPRYLIHTIGHSLKYNVQTSSCLVIYV